METQRLEIAENNLETTKQRTYHFVMTIWSRLASGDTSMCYVQPSACADAGPANSLRAEGKLLSISTWVPQSQSAHPEMD